jgi:soluble lytic murein transglycosylase-like protein
MIWKDEKKYDKLIDGMALGYNIPAPLIKGVIAKESGFNPNAMKSEPQIKDASRGLMQVLYRTAKNLGFKGVAEELYHPGTNVRYGVELLAENLARTKGKVDAAVAAYNAGWSKVRPGDAPRKPDMTFVNQDYVDTVNVYAAYFAGRLTAEEVKTFQRSKMLGGGSILFF